MKKKISKTSYSQSGEDMIADFFFEAHGILKPSYIDIGAHDPFYLSNTAYFYKKGARGINIDANPICIQEFKKYRNKDINLNVGIGKQDGQLVDFYVIDPPSMSTFSKEQAEELVEKYKMRINKEVKVEVRTVNSIVDEYCNGIFPDFLSLDAEGLDLDIIKSIDYSRSSPKMICCETLRFGDGFRDAISRKENDIASFLSKVGYCVLADTCINTLFVKNELI